MKKIYSHYFSSDFVEKIKNGDIRFEFAYSGEEALDCLTKYQHEAVLILSDINMPGMSGLELLSQIKEKHHVPPPIVMMITAYGDQDNYNKAMELGADDFLTKPVDFQSLKERIKNIA